ncbi:MAG TPA: hypothetical protein VGL13_13390 [Polyangiaceae bacterium]
MRLFHGATTHPARVNATHGAGTLEPSGLTMLGIVPATGSVQYPNELGDENAPVLLVRT